MANNPSEKVFFAVFHKICKVLYKQTCELRQIHHLFCLNEHMKLLFFQEKWQDSRRWQLAVATELPELEETPREAGQGFSNFKNGRQGNNFYRNDRFKIGSEAKF